MAGEEFSLKWNDHSKVFFAGAEKLAEEQEYTDVTLAAGDKLIPAHKMVLSICSPFFQRLFRQLGSDKSTVIYLKDILPRHLDLLIQYMYKGEIKVEENELVTILNTAQSLEIRGLTDTVSGPKSKEKEGLALKLSPAKELNFASPVKDASKTPKRGPTPQSYNHQFMDNGGGEKKRSKMDMVNEAQQILDSQAANKANADAAMTEVKQEFGAVTIERGAKSQNNFQKQEVTDSAVANMGYEGYEDENDTTEYLPQDGMVLQDDDRVEEITMLGVQMWRCKVCNKLGTYKSNMLRHTMTHTGERPHPCRFCSQSFSISSNRHRHEKKCKLNPSPSLEALVPSLINQFNGHPSTGGPGRPPHHRVGPLAAGALMAPGAFPGFPGSFPALPPPEGIGKPPSLSRQGGRHGEGGGEGELHDGKAEGEMKKGVEGGQAGYSGSQGRGAQNSFPMPNAMFQQAFPWGLPYPHHGQQAFHPGKGHRQAGSITEIEQPSTPTTPSSHAPPPPPEVFDRLEQQQAAQQTNTTEQVQCTPTLPF